MEVVGKGLAPDRGTCREHRQRRGDGGGGQGGERGGRGDGRAGDLPRRRWGGRRRRPQAPCPRHGVGGPVDREIARQDIQRVLDAAQSAALPQRPRDPPRHCRSSSSTNRGESPSRWGCLEPAGSHRPPGHRQRHPLQDAPHLLNRAGVEVLEMVFEPLATAAAVVTPDERELGVLLVDIGGGTTEYACSPTARSTTAWRCRSAPATSPTTWRWCFHPVRRGRADQDQDRLLPGQPGHRRRGGGGAQRRRRRRAGGAAARAVRDPPAPRRGDVQPDPRRPRQARLRGGAAGRRRAHRRRRPARRSARDGRGDLRRRRPLRPAPRAPGLVDVISSPSWSTASGLLLYGRAREAGQETKRKRSGFSVRAMVGSLRGMFEDLL